MDTSTEMPKYRCHKEVHALKIQDIEYDHVAAKKEGRETDGSALIHPEEDGFAPFKVDANYLNKHSPVAGGYYVVYSDGYQSFSPAAAFEGGYVRV